MSSRRLQAWDWLREDEAVPRWVYLVLLMYGAWTSLHWIVGWVL